MSRAVIEARGVGVDIGGRSILGAVDLDVVSGEILALVGPNGAGKSTLLSVLAGDLRPDRGTVTIDGTPIGRIRAAELARRRAVLMQSNQVSFPFTVAQVVRMGRAPWDGRPEDEHDDEIVAHALAVAEVEHLADRRVPSLSGGERARAAFARVLAQSCGIAFFDEPTAALDIRHQEAVLRHARRLAADGGAVVIVLHDLNLAAAYADRVAIIADGELAAAGDSERVLDGELLSRVYRHRIDVLRLPGRPHPLVVPDRSDAAAMPAPADSTRRSPHHV